MMKCPFRKIMVVVDHDEMNVHISKKVAMNFGECYGRECPYYENDSMGMGRCRRVDNE